LAAQSVPSGWKIVKDDKSTCQMAVPADWSVPSPTGGSANSPKLMEAMAVVVNDPFQLKPMPEAIQKMEKVQMMFENTAKRVFHSTAANKSTNYKLSVPAKNGACTVQVTFQPSFSKDAAKQIALTAGPAK
jgi:hypothetical protein